MVCHVIFHAQLHYAHYPNASTNTLFTMLSLSLGNHYTAQHFNHKDHILFDYNRTIVNQTLVFHAFLKKSTTWHILFCSWAQFMVWNGQDFGINHSITNKWLPRISVPPLSKNQYWSSIENPFHRLYRKVRLCLKHTY